MYKVYIVKIISIKEEAIYVNENLFFIIIFTIFW